MSQDDASLTARLSEAFQLASSHNAASEKVLLMLSDVARAAHALSVISANDRLDEISTPALRMFLIPKALTTASRSISVVGSPLML